MKNLLLGSLLFLASCGGGSSSNDSTFKEDVSGRYLWTASLTDNGCNLDLVPNVQYAFEVEQLGEVVKVTNLADNTEFLGSRLGDGYAVSGTVENSSCQISNLITDFGNGSGEIGLLGSCNNGEACQSSYQANIAKR